MNLDEFIFKYEGKNVDYDGAYGFQCVDLFRQYVKEVLDVPEHTGTVNGAKDLFLNFDKMPKMKKYFDKVYPPKPGDIVVFNRTEKNPYGHVAIVVHATNKAVVTFEQDGYRPMKGCYINVWQPEFILGFLRGKNAK